MFNGEVIYISYWPGHISSASSIFHVVVIRTAMSYSPYWMLKLFSRNNCYSPHFGTQSTYYFEMNRIYSDCWSSHAARPFNSANAHYLAFPDLQVMDWLEAVARRPVTKGPSANQSRPAVVVILRQLSCWKFFRHTFASTCLSTVAACPFTRLTWY